MEENINDDVNFELGLSGKMPKPNDKSKTSRRKKNTAESPSDAETTSVVEKAAKPRKRSTKASSVETLLNTLPNDAKYVYFIKLLDGSKTGNVSVHVGISANVKSYRESIERGTPIKIKTEKVIKCDSVDDASSIYKDFRERFSNGLVAKDWYKIKKTDLADFLQEHSSKLITESKAVPRKN